VNIGYVHSTPFPSVAANVVQVAQMCRALATLGHRVTLFVPRAPSFATDDSARLAAHTIFGDTLPFHVHFVERKGWREGLTVLGSLQSTLKELKKYSLDLIYSRNPWSVEFLPRIGVPYIYEIHEERVHIRSALLNFLLRNHIVRAAQKPSCRKIITISAALAETWQDFGIPAEKIYAAHDGVDLELFTNSLDREQARTELANRGIPPAELYGQIIVYTGALREDRGVNLMLKAAARFPALKFFFVGGTDEEISRCKLSADLSRVHNVRFAGRVTHQEVPLWLAAADMLLMMWTWKTPTIRGASPMKLFEYMAAERLIVGPAFPVVCEVLDNDKEAVLFQPDDLEAFVAALHHARDLMDSGAAAVIARNARLKVARDYTWTTRCQNILTAAGF
jgi:glycosyltransferase involved in cell wall biosynthesis